MSKDLKQSTQTRGGQPSEDQQNEESADGIVKLERSEKVRALMRKSVASSVNNVLRTANTNGSK